MQIVIQQGHVINREDIEFFLERAPASWTKAIKSFIVYVAIDEPFCIKYYAKKKVLGIHISKKYRGTTSEAIEEIAVASQAIEELGHLPEKLAKARETYFRQNWIELEI
ncbi:MAG: hypothetical protein GY820_01625 [Gammaproteobacteria bacterium]|nr:hypothetical protein [Gammaproteobacteria bacterium]